LLAACAPKSPKPTAEQMAAGERAYQKCYSCHALEPAKNDLTGPTLHNIVERSIASAPGFNYSSAMQRFAQAEGRWGKVLLDKFIADPEAIVPGTSMTFQGISDPAERTALIAYLEQDQTRAKAASLP
jgi:cytochrome c